MKEIEVKKFLEEEAKSLLSKIADKFSLEVKEEGDFFNIKINAEEEAAVIIGRFGETIRALQRILEVIAFKKFGEKVNILLDVNNFREEQRKRLEEKAKEWGNQVLEENRPISIKNLSGLERKIIHEYISDNFPELTTESIGEGKGRKLIIEKK